MANNLAKELRTLINERIDRNREKIVGHAVSSPYLVTLGGYKAWVVDVVVYSNAEILEAVPLAEAGRSVRDFVNQGTPVEIQKSNAGQFYVVGLADRQRGTVVKKTYSLITEGFGYADGWRRDSGGSWETGNQNSVPPTTIETVNYSYSVFVVAYGNLDYGADVYGKMGVTRTP